MSVTPLQLARAYAALANGGTLYSPRIGEELLSPTGKVVQQINPPVAGHLPASKTTLAYIRSALAGVITSGTAAGAFGGFPLGKVCVAGKTGTAQVFGKNSTSVFASFAPCDHPKYVVVMMIPDSGYGADVSGPAVRQIWDAIYGLEGHKAALPGGVLPPLPQMNKAGQIVQSARQAGQEGRADDVTREARAEPRLGSSPTRPGRRVPAGRRQLAPAAAPGAGRAARAAAGRLLAARPAGLRPRVAAAAPGLDPAGSGCWR